MLDPGCLAWTDKGEITAGRTQAQIYGTNPGTGLYFHAMPWAAVCVGDTDTDLDGYCDATEVLLGSCATNTPLACDAQGLGFAPGTLAANSMPESTVIDATISGSGSNVRPQANVDQSCSDEVDNDGDTAFDDFDSGCSDNAPTEAVPLPGSNLANRWRHWAHDKVVDKDIVCVKIDNLPSSNGTYRNGWFLVAGQTQPPASAFKLGCGPQPPAPMPAPANPGFIPNVQWNDIDHSSDNVRINKTVSLAGIAPVPCLVGLGATAPSAGPAVVGPLDEYEPKGWSTEAWFYLPQLRFSIGLPPGQATCNYRFTVTKVPTGVNVTFSDPAVASIDGTLVVPDEPVVAKAIKCVKVDSRPWVQVSAADPDQPWPCYAPPFAPLYARPVALWTRLGVKNLPWNDLDKSADNVAIQKTVTLVGTATGPNGVACLVGLDGNEPTSVGPAVVGPLDEYEPTGYSTEPADYRDDLKFSIALPTGYHHCDYEFTVTKVAKPGSGQTLVGGTITATVLGTLIADRDYDGEVDANADTTVHDNCGDAKSDGQINTEETLVVGGAQHPVPIPLTVDALGDVCDPDDDNDLFTDVIEAYLPTITLDNCPDGAGLPATRTDAWPLDMDKNRTITVVGDVLKYSGKIGKTVAANPEVRRLDLDANGTITVVGDVLKYSGKIGQACL
jgi:hypothetical protein